MVSVSEINVKEKIFLSQSVFWVQVEAMKYLMLNTSLKKKKSNYSRVYVFGICAEFCALF